MPVLWLGITQVDTAQLNNISESPSTFWVGNSNALALMMFMFLTTGVDALDAAAGIGS
jgi:hypothetical protein